MAAWPGSLPQSLQGGGDYQEKPENTVIRSTMETGIVKLRRRQTRTYSAMRGTMMLNGSQAGALITFFQDTIKGGALPFTGSLGRSGLNQTYQFVEEPVISHLGGDTYTVSLNLLVMP